MTPPLVSIVIPCYNAERWIADAIESGLKQSHPNKEIVVVDDGSTDGSVDVLKSFNDRIHWESGPNHGGCAARNRGVELARGEYIQFLDADDLLTPDCIERKLSFSAAPNQRVCCDLESLDTGVAFSPPEWWTQTAWPLEFILAKGSPQTAQPLHRKEELLAVGGFREHLPCAQEFDLHLRMAIKLGIEFVSNGHLGVRFRPTEGSVSRKAGGLKMPLAFASILADAWPLLRASPKNSPRRAAILAGTLARASRKIYRRGAHAEALKLAAIAQSISPDWYQSAYLSWTSRSYARLFGFAATEKLFQLLRRPAKKADS